ncbi:HAD family hydrolase [Fluviispira vulneris]|uniref:HAD family hydrolase n=1 Tax=Fluviispira vulneris TaxID=2763012 RepID=UPI0016451FAD|nr:HAD-IA family hydrolase [Fluviispira vulneris]
MLKFNFFIFDFDGNICDTNKAVHYCITKTLDEYNINFDKSYLEYLISQGLSLKDTFAELAKNTCVESLIKQYRVIYNSGKGIEMSNLYPNVHEVFDYLKLNNSTIFVLSNKGIISISEALNYFQLDKYIDMCIADSLEMKKKPDPMIYNEVIRTKYTYLNPQEVLMIGDKVGDINFAKNSFISSCWAKYGDGNKEECIDLNLTYKIDSFSSLLEII